MSLNQKNSNILLLFFLVSFVSLGVSWWHLTYELYNGLAQWVPPRLKNGLTVLEYKLHTCERFKDFPRNKVHVLLRHVFNEHEYDWLPQQVGVFYFITTVFALTVVLWHDGYKDLTLFNPVKYLGENCSAGTEMDIGITYQPSVQACDLAEMIL